MLGRLLVLLFFCSFPLLAQSSEQKTAERLTRLGEVIAETSENLGSVREQLQNSDQNGAGEEAADELKDREEELSSRLEELKFQFNELATGVAEQDFSGVAGGELDLADEVKEILRPGIEELKELTKRPRETEELRTRRERLKEQKETATQALSSLGQFRDLESPSAQQVEDLRITWRERLEDADLQLEALELLLEQREEEGRSVLGPVSRAFSEFFRGRGLNLLKAIGAAVVTWLLLRWLWARVGDFRIFDKVNKGAFAWRLVDLSALVLIALSAASAALLVLYFSGDWLLLTLFVVMLAGLGWTAKSTIPRVTEQTKMLLNLGPVRKGERLNFEGVPWEVGTIGFYTVLRNGELTGGLIRVSLKRLTGLRSRPHDVREAWFPTKAEDWVLINGSLGKVVMQTPEYVQILRLGGARETFPTPEFLGMAPVNLSNNFRVKVRFGIDYEHQAIVTDEAVSVFKAAIDQGLADFLGGRELMNSVNVEFASAGASSLDFDILADFKGGAAERYEKIKRAIQRLCVEVCNERGWVIPFTQVTVHSASAAAEEAGSAVILEHQGE
ncbi:MAG: mechanosensitive ion channel [Verrucomicrobiota bacterium JB023]|nr:mechanosensitive ion channel [Verrucomicrobiota bacterium JB023]